MTEFATNGSYGTENLNKNKIIIIIIIKWEY